MSPSKDHDDSKDPKYQEQIDWGLSTAEMTVRAEVEANKAEERLLDAIMALRVYLSPKEIVAFDRVQERWQGYRCALQNYAREQFAGGTNAAVSGAIAWVEETTRRADEILTDARRRAGPSSDSNKLS